jgi:hypothetical protein
VHRIDITEPDGTLRMVISNKARLPNVIIKGQEHPEMGEPRPQAGMIFYNDEGTENGGLIFGGRKNEKGEVVDSGGSLSFDKYGAGQIVQLAGIDDKNDHFAGLGVNDGRQRVWVGNRQHLSRRGRREKAYPLAGHSRWYAEPSFLRCRRARPARTCAYQGVEDAVKGKVQEGASLLQQFGEPSPAPYREELRFPDLHHFIEDKTCIRRVRLSGPVALISQSVPRRSKRTPAICPSSANSTL